MEIHEEQGITIARIPRRLDVSTAPEVESRLLDLLVTGITQLACDFADVEYISSAGLRVMLVVSKKVKAAGGTFAILSIRPQTFEPFRLAGFDRIMTFKNDLNA